MLQWDETEHDPFGQRGLRDLHWGPLFRVVLALPLILLALFAVRSFYRYDFVEKSQDGIRNYIVSQHGEIHIVRDAAFDDGPGTGWAYDTGEADERVRRWSGTLARWVGVELVYDRVRLAERRRFRVKWRTVLAVAAVPYVAEFFWRRRRQRLSPADESSPSRSSAAAAPRAR